MADPMREAGADAGATMTRAGFAARAVLRCRDDGVAALAAAGINLPVRPRGVVSGPLGAVLWLGPDEWLVVADLPYEPVRQRVDASLGGCTASLVDVSHRQAGLVVEGRKAARVLNAGCPLDLSLPAFPVGTVMRTILGKAEIVLWRTGEERFHVEVWRSFAPYVEDFLAEAVWAAPEF